MRRRSRRGTVALGQKRELPAEQQFRGIQRSDVGPQGASAEIQRAIERRFSAPPPVEATMAARHAPRDQREAVDTRPVTRPGEARPARGDLPIPRGCSSTCSVSDTPPAGTLSPQNQPPGASTRRTSGEQRLGMAHMLEHLLCEYTSSKPPSANGIEIPSKVSNRASLRVRSRDSGESGTSIPTHSTCGSRARNRSTESPVPQPRSSTRHGRSSRRPISRSM